MNETKESVDQLEARYRKSRSVADLLAWSDAVGAESERLSAELRRLCARMEPAALAWLGRAA